MKLVRVKNVMGMKLIIPAVRGRDGRALSFQPGECKDLLPATVNHPAVSVYIGRGLQLEEASAVEVPKVKVLEPVVSPAPQSVPVFVAPVVEPEILDLEIQVAPATPAGLFSAAPGVTEENEAALSMLFLSTQELACAALDVLQDLGFTKTAAKKLISWAASQPSSAE
jgi:hypothetical protein